MDTLNKLNQYFSQEPTKEQMAWGIIHDVNNILLHYVKEKEILISEELLVEKIEKLSPSSKIEDIAELFHSVKLNPEWDIWW